LAAATRPTLVVVSGPAGSGKTTLAHAIAKAIPCPAICRDEIKEGMVHAQGAGFEAAPGDTLTERTYPLFFDVVRVLLEGGVTVVAEAAFQDALWRKGLEPLMGLAEVRVVHCVTDPSLATERFKSRGKRRAHVTLSEVPGFEPLSLKPSVEVDTTDGYDPDIPEILEFIG
jgi:predicted kinase